MNSLPADPFLLRNFCQREILEDNILIDPLLMVSKEFAVKIIKKCILDDLFYLHDSSFFFAVAINLCYHNGSRKFCQGFFLDKKFVF